MQLTIYQDYQALSDFVAAEIIDLVVSKPDAVICLASGDTPKLACQILASSGNQEKIDFRKCTFIGLDEWVGVPPENAGSCNNFFQTLLLKPLRFSSSQIHLFNAMAEDLNNECEKMDKVISAAGGIDLMVVGVGMNGHIGFNEPGVAFENHCHVVDLAPLTISVGQKYFQGTINLHQGITVGLQHLMETKKVFMIANGLKKAPIIKKTMTAAIDNNFPATIMRNHRNGYILIDEKAGSELQK